MGFTINEKITTELTYKDVALIAVALGEYQRNIKGIGKDEFEKHAMNLVNRLGVELYDVREENDGTRDNNCTLCNVTNSATIKPLDTNISPQMEQYLRTMEEVNKWLERSATELLMIPKEQFE